MKGVDWTYYAAPPSNLSAFAAPFSVNRSDVSAPFIDVESAADTLPPIHFASYGYDFFSNPNRESNSSKPYGYSGFQGLDSYSAQFPSPALPSNDEFSYDLNTPKSSLVEAQPYYPPYVSSPIHDHSSSSVAPNHWSSSSAAFPSLGGDYANPPSELGFAGQSAVLWNQLPEFNSHGKGKQVGIESSFSSMYTDVTGSVVDERINQGYQDLNNNDWEKHNVPASVNQLDEKSCWWGTMKPMPVEFLGTSVMQFPPMSLETHHEDPLKLVADSGNHHLSYTGSYDKHLRHDDKPPRVDTVSSVPRTGLVPDLNIGDTIADGDIGQNLFCNTEAYRMPSPGHLGLHLLRLHLERNEPCSSKNAMVLDKNVSRDVAEHVLKERYGFQNPHANMDNLSLRLNATEDVSSVDKSFEGVDRCNPAVDSPCWKGASAHISQYESYESLPPEYMHKNEECFGSVIQEPQNYMLDTEDNVKKSCENSNSYKKHTEIVYQETNSAGPPRKFSVRGFSREGCRSDFAVNAVPFQTETSCDSGHQGLNDITEMKKNSVPSVKLTDCESVSSHTENQVVEENELKSQKQHTSSIADANAGCNVHKCLECGTSRPAEHALSSPYSVVDTTTTAENSSGKVSTKKLNVQMLVDTMQNLSELLLCHCLNDDACELNERECNVLKNVISNLNSCAFKKAGQIAPAHEGLSDQSETSRHAGELHELQQNASLKRPQLTKIGPESSKVEFENPPVAEGNLHFRSVKPQGKLSDSIPPRDDAEMTKTDNMTKALKRILSENFLDDEGAEPQTVLYKNLWLEAEAALCSVYYRARYNQMKIEMDKHSYKERDTEEQSKSEVIPTLSQIQSSATKVNNYPKPDSSAQDLPVFNATNLKELSHLKSSTDSQKLDDIENNFSACYNQMKNEMNKHSYKERDMEEQSKSEVIPTLSQIQSSATIVNNYPKPDSSARDLPVFHATNLKELSHLKSSADMNKPQAMTQEEKDSEKLDGFIQNYTVSSTDMEAGIHDEASVMTRHRVLKSRLIKSQAMTHEEKDSQKLDRFVQNYTVSSTDKEAGIHDEASVMNRHRVLKARLFKSPIYTINLEEQSVTADKLAHGRGENQNQVNICQDSEKNKADYEASVVARFHILKSRLEDSSSNSSEGELFKGFGSVGKGMNDTTSNNASEGKNSDVHLNAAEVHLNTYTAADKSIPEDWEDNQEIQPFGTYEFRLPNYYSDGLASDWEHVEKSS